MKSDDKKLLKEYVESLLVEFDGGYGDYSGYAGMAADMSPFGMHFAGKDQLYSTFIKPFVDVFDVAKGKTKEMARRSLTLAQVGFETIATSLIPALSSDYAKIFEKQKNDLDQIKNEYADVYKASWDALKTNDVAMLAFLSYPGAYLTSVAARKAPNVALGLIDVISGGTLGNVVEKVKTRFADVVAAVKDAKGKKKEDLFVDEGVLSEKEDQDKANNADKFSKIVTSKKLVNAAVSKPKAQRMQAAARKVIDTTLRSVQEKATAVAHAKTLKDVIKITGKNIPNLDPSIFKDQTAQKHALDAVKKSAKELYAKELEAQVKEAVGAGIPKDSPFVISYMKTIKAIRSL